MPISGPSSFLSTMTDFLAHWDDVNDALAPTVFTLPDGATFATLDNLKTELEARRDAVTDLNVDRSVARATLTAKIVALQARMVQFNARVRTNFGSHPLAAALNDAFQPGSAEDVVREALRKMSRLWGKVDAVSPAPAGLTLPMTLDGGVYGLASFDEDRETLRSLYQQLSDLDVDLDVARAEREVTQAAIYAILKSYRQKVQSDLSGQPALVASLPRLTPEPGRTPAAVVVHAAWDAGTEQAKLAWAASSDADLEKYEVRGVPGDSYNTDDEVVLGNVPADGAREFLTGYGLAASGLITGFKVYVVLSTGNEKGSPPVYVTRP